MANEKEKQFAKDLKANQDASDKLDKELNAPQMTIAPKVAIKSRKMEILEEYGGVRTNIPLNHPEFWNL